MAWRKISIHEHSRVVHGCIALYLSTRNFSTKICNFYTEDGGSKVLRKVSTCLQTALLHATEDRSLTAVRMSIFMRFLLLLLLLSALQLFVSFGLLNYFFPLFPLLRPLFPIGHPHLPHVVLPSYSWSSLRSCCIRFPFVYGLGHSFIGHSFYMLQPGQSFVFYVFCCIFVINCFFSQPNYQTRSSINYELIKPNAVNEEPYM